MASGPRKQGEAFSKYRARLKDEGYTARHKLRGKVLWDSQRQGTYVREKHGELK